MFGHGRCHTADRTSAGDQYVFTEQRKAEGCVHGIAERIKDAGYIQVDTGSMMPDVGHR